MNAGQPPRACADADTSILIAVHPNLPARAPDVIEMLRRWDFNVESYKAVARWQHETPTLTPTLPLFGGLPDTPTFGAGRSLMTPPPLSG